MRLNFSPLLTRKARLFGRLAPRLTELLRYEASVFHRKSVGCRPRGPRFRIGMGNPYADRFHVRSLRETRLTVRKSRGFAANIAGRNLRAQVLKVKRRAERYGRYPYRSVQYLRVYPRKSAGFAANSVLHLRRFHAKNFSEWCVAPQGSGSVKNKRISE